MMDITRERPPARVRPARPQLPLFGERGEIARWLAEGERLSQTYGARMPAAVAAAKRAIIPQADPVSRFIAERCEIDMAAAAAPEGSTFYEFSSKLYAAFIEWRGRAKAPPMTLTAFGRRFGALGFPVAKRGHGRIKARIGIRLKVPA
jgi:phage/plasmid-associated DNA primase